MEWLKINEDIQVARPLYIAKGKSRSRIWNALLNKAEKAFGVKVMIAQYVYSCENRKHGKEGLVYAAYANVDDGCRILISKNKNRSKNNFFLAYGISEAIYGERATKNEKVTLAWVLIEMIEGLHRKIVDKYFTDKETQERLLELIRKHNSGEDVA